MRSFLTTFALLLLFACALVVTRSAGAQLGPVANSAHQPAASPAACNRPAAEMPPAPDGCPGWAPIAPPATPIPPPCITIAQAEQWDEEDTAVTELTIYVDHPELGQGIRTYTHLARYQFRNPEWELTDADWEASCGKDEGPLTWTTVEILNSGRLSALGIYTAPLPGTYLDLLAELGGRRWQHVYLALIRSDRGTHDEAQKPNQ